MKCVTLYNHVLYLYSVLILNDTNIHCPLSIANSVIPRKIDITNVNLDYMGITKYSTLLDFGEDRMPLTVLTDLFSN